MKIIKNKTKKETIKLSNLIIINPESISSDVEEINYVDISSTKEGHINDIKKIKGKENFPSRAKRKTQINDIIYSTVRPNLKGYSIIKDDNLTVSTGFAVIRCLDEFDSIFVYNNLKRSKIEHLILSFCEGGNYPAFKANDLKNINIVKFSKEERKKIAKILSEKEEHINNLKTLIEKLEKRNQYYANKLLTGELRVREDANGNIEFYKNPDDNWKKEKVNGKIREIPKDWELRKNLYIFNDEKKSKLAVKDASNTGKYPFFNSSSEQSMTHHTPNINGEYLILSTGGKASVQYFNGKFSYSSDTFLIYSKKENNKYLYYFWNNNIKKIERCFQGSGLKHLKRTLFNNEKTAIPYNHEQEIIVLILDNLNLEIQKIKNLLQKENEEFNWLSEKLLSGEYTLKHN